MHQLSFKDNLISQHAYIRDLHFDNVAIRQETARVLENSNTCRRTSHDCCPSRDSRAFNHKRQLVEC